MCRGAVNPYVERNRKAARTRAMIARSRAAQDPFEAAQARLEQAMAGAERGVETIVAPTLGEIRARVDRAILRQAQDERERKAG